MPEQQLMNAASFATRRYEVIVVGASLAGVISAALMAKRGYKVALVEQLDYVGGRVGGTKCNGYWFNWGHRDGHGYGDGGWIFHNGAIAAREVGIEDKFVWRTLPPFRSHGMPEGHVTQMHQADAFGEITDDGLANYRNLVEFFHQDPRDEVALAVKEAMEKIGVIPEDAAWGMIELTMGEWLDRNVPLREARFVILTMLESMCASPGEHASVGRFVLHTQGALNYKTAASGIPDDPEVGGMQGVVMPWVRAFKELGGDMWLGWKPMEVTVDHRHVTGVVATNISNLVQVFEAPVVITDYECWKLKELVDENLLPRDYVAMAEKASLYRTAVISWWAGLKRLPRRRSDGEIETLGKQRLLHGNGAVKNYHGIYDFPSEYSRNQAPPGKHTMHITLPAHGEYVWRNFAAAKHDIDVSLDYLHNQVYLDLDDCIEWSAYQFVPDQVMYYLKPVKLPPIKVATLDGLYVASPTVEGTGAWIDREADAALNACNLAVAEFGPYLARRRGDKT
jgi:phytoene dehydrogenase-like protein